MGSFRSFTRKSLNILSTTFFFSSLNCIAKQFHRKGSLSLSSAVRRTSPMSASSSDASKTMMERKKKGAPIKFLVPLIYAPVLPLIRLSLRHKPVIRDRLFGLVLAGAFAHGFYLVTDIYDAESK